MPYTKSLLIKITSILYLDSVQARLVSLPLAALGDFVREVQSATGEELSALLLSVLDRAFKGEL